MTGFRDWRARLSNSEFTVSRDLVFLRNPHDLGNDAQLPLRLFRFVAKHGIPLARQTEQRLSAVAGQAAPAGSQFWREFLSQPIQ